MKIIKMTVLFFLIIACLVGSASADNGKIALVSDDYSHDINALNRDTEKVIRSAVEFYGFQCDVIRYDDLESGTLDEYMSVIAVSPDTPEKAGYITTYGESKNGHVMLFGDVDNATLLTYGITNNGKIDSIKTFVLNAEITDHGIMTGITNDFYYYDYWDVALSGRAVYNTITTATDDPLIIQSENEGCNLTWINMDVDVVHHFAFQFIYNFLKISIPSEYPWITGNNPYTLDLSILMRYDDYGFTSGGGSYERAVPAYVEFYNISHECLIGAPGVDYNQTIANYVSDADVVPHVYNHEDMSIKSETNLNIEFGAAETVFNMIYGASPTGVILPGNHYSYAVGKVMNERGYKYVCGAYGSAANGTHLWGYCYGANDSENDLIFVGRQLENPVLTEATYIPSWYYKYLLSRDYIAILDHPNARATAGTLNETLTKFTGLVDGTTTKEGHGFLKHEEFIDHVIDGKHAYVVGSNIIVDQPVATGLSFKKPSLTEQIIIDNSVVTVLTRNNKTMLPALTAGTHTFGYTTDYPKITSYTNGSIIKDGYYDISSKSMLFSISDDDELFNKTTISTSGLDGWYILQKNDALISSFDANGSDVFTNLTEGVYEITEVSVSSVTGNSPMSTHFACQIPNTQFFWDFENDGIIDSTKQNPVQTYGKAGTYTVNLTVQNEFGTFSTVKPDYITVSAQPEIDTLSKLYWWLRGYLSFLVSFEVLN